MSKRAWAGKYTEEEIEALLEGYPELIYKKNRPSILVRVADIDRSLARMRKTERDAVVLTRIVGHTNEDVGTLLGISEAAVRKRVRWGLEFIYAFLNPEAI